MTIMHDDEIQLLAGDLILNVRPGYGGRITRFLQRRGKNVFNWFVPTPENGPFDSQRPHFAGCYPLVPFSNRIRDGILRIDGRSYQLDPHPMCPPHAMHGDGRLAHWKVIELSADHLSMSFDYDPG